MIASAVPTPDQRWRGHEPAVWGRLGPGDVRQVDSQGDRGVLGPPTQTPPRGLDDERLDCAQLASAAGQKPIDEARVLPGAMGRKASGSRPPSPPRHQQTPGA